MKAIDRLESSFATFLAYYWDGRVVGTFERSFYALWKKEALQGKPVQGHEAKLTDLSQVADQLRARFWEAEDEARRAVVFPGTRRDLRARYRMEHRGWD